MPFTSLSPLMLGETEFPWEMDLEREDVERVDAGRPCGFLELDVSDLGFFSSSVGAELFDLFDRKLRFSTGILCREKELPGVRQAIRETALQAWIDGKAQQMQDSVYSCNHQSQMKIKRRRESWCSWGGCDVEVTGRSLTE